VESARRLRQLWSRHQKARDLIALGAYTPGHDLELDAAVRLYPQMLQLLQQDMNVNATLTDSVMQLRRVTTQ
jgi:flagellum-specific ATP synthase